MSKRTSLAVLDDKTSVWQANWVFTCLMPGKHFTTAGDKLWVHIMCQDVSVRVEARMGEKIALELSGFANKEEFLQAVSDGDVAFSKHPLTKIFSRRQRGANQSGAIRR